MDQPFKIDFIGIGAAKAGTTWLGHVLAEHPEICMSEPKEVHFFNDRIAFRHPIMKPNYQKGFAWYQKYFHHCTSGKVKGEITPRYSIDPVVPERIFRHHAGIKLFYCLRNPADRIESHYNFSKYFVRKEDRPIDEAIRSEPEYLDMSMYHANLQRYLEYFPLNQFFFVWYEAIRDDPGKLVHDVYQFLGVNPDFVPPSLHKKANPARESRSIGFQFFTRKIIFRLNEWGMSGLVHWLKRTSLRDWVMRLNSRPLKKDRLPLSTRTFILQETRKDIQSLENLLGKDLSHWMTAE